MPCYSPVLWIISYLLLNTYSHALGVNSQAASCQLLFATDLVEYLRSPEDKASDPQVLWNALKNYRDVRQLFLRAYQSGTAGDEYGPLMRQLHKVMVQGMDGKTPYKGFHPNHKEEFTLIPGQFVFDRDYLDELLKDNANGEISRDTIILLEIEPTIDMINETTARFPLDFLKNQTTDFATKIEGIPAALWPQNWRTSPSPLRGDIPNYHHSYPPLPFNEPGREMYFARAKELMQQMIKEKNVSRRMRLLADYYHVAINGHFFPAVNNSILMAQVNVILEISGYQPLSPGILDYEALVTSTQKFRQRFLQLLSRRE